jgi:hypothetical protein
LHIFFAASQLHRFREFDYFNNSDLIKNEYRREKRSIPGNILCTAFKHTTWQTKETRHMSSYPHRTTLPPDAPSFGERYQIVKKLGSGGMGAVYQAVDSSLEKTVAVKILLPGLSNETIIRFQQEAKAAARLDHANIVKVLDFGQTPNGDLFLIMDFVGTTSLEDVVNQKKRIALDKALPIFIQIANGLEHAHKNGILHRDVKPSNVMFSERQEGNVQIVDFGLAKLQSTDDSQKLTTTGTRVGSPLYMSPEQAGGVEADVRSDIYSLGCLMYKALTGSPPLQGETFLDTIQMHLDTVPLLLNDTDCGVEFPVEIEELVAKALEKDPEHRFQSATELRAALEGLQELSRARLALAASFAQLAHDPHLVEADREKQTLTNLAKKLDAIWAFFVAHRKAALVLAILFVSAGWILFFQFQGKLRDAKVLKIKTLEAPAFMGEATATVIDDGMTDSGKEAWIARQRNSSRPKKKSWDRIPEYSKHSADQMLEEIESTPSMKKLAEDPDTREAIRSGKLHQLWKNREMRDLYKSKDMIELEPQLSTLWNDAKLGGCWSDPIVQEWLRTPKLWKSWSSKKNSPAIAKFAHNKGLQLVMSDARFFALLEDARFQKLALDSRFRLLLADPVNMKLMRCIEAYRDQMKNDVANIMCPIQSDLSR